MDISYEEVGQILRLIDELDCDTVTLEVGDLKLHVSRSGTPAEGFGNGAAATAQPAAAGSPQAAGGVDPSPAAAAPAPDAEPEAGWVPVTAAMVGIFYRAPAPDEPPFAELGDTVKTGEQIGILEVMKLMNEVTASVDGRIARIDAENAELVDFGRTLMWIEPAP